MMLMTAIIADRKNAGRQSQDLLTAIFDQYAPLLYRYSLRLCRDQIKADQIVGDVFTQLLERLDAGEEPRMNLTAYLYKLTTQFVVDYVQGRKSATPPEERRDVQNMPIPTQSENENLLDVVASVITEKLNYDEQQVVVLRFQEDFNMQDTAMILGKDVNTIKTIQNDAIAKLQNALAGRNDEP